MADDSHVAIGIGAAALKWIGASRERTDDFELYLVAETGTLPGYGEHTFTEAVNAAAQRCLCIARQLMRLAGRG
jgi:hypothetical protein